jgi:hypothetical protein
VVLDELRNQMLHMHLALGKHVHVTTKERAVARSRTRRITTPRPSRPDLPRQREAKTRTTHQQPAIPLTTRSKRLRTKDAREEGGESQPRRAIVVRRQRSPQRDHLLDRTEESSVTHINSAAKATATEPLRLASTIPDEAIDAGRKGRDGKANRTHKRIIELTSHCQGEVRGHALKPVMQQGDAAVLERSP